MKNIKIEIGIKLCDFTELPKEEQEILTEAIRATDNSYANYSKFYVGAALRLNNGKIMIGATQENAAFPSGLCAERTAIFAAQANYPDQPIRTLAVAAKNSDGLLKQPVTPCGACRQVILEIEDRYKSPIRILLYGTEGVYCIDSVKDLLPLSFIDENMR